MPDASPSASSSGTRQLESHDGARLAYRARTVSEPAGSLLFIHGLGDHSGWFEPLAAAANERRLDWYGLDLRGHGHSDGKRGHVESFGDLLDDVDLLRGVIASTAAASRGPSPLVVGGHSLGGLAALRYAQERHAGLAGLLLVAPFLAVAAPVPAWKRFTGRLANRLVPGLTLDNGLDYTGLISDPAALAAHEADPLTHRRISARLWAEVLTAQERVRGQAPLPALFQLAADDRAVDTRVAETLCTDWAYPSRCVVYPGARHDLYHDRVARQVLADAMDWINDSI